MLCHHFMAHNIRALCDNLYAEKTNYCKHHNNIFLQKGRRKERAHKRIHVKTLGVAALE